MICEVPRVPLGASLKAFQGLSRRGIYQPLDMSNYSSRVKVRPGGIVDHYLFEAFLTGTDMRNTGS